MSINSQDHQIKKTKPHPCRPRLASQCLINQRSPKRSRKKRRKHGSKKNRLRKTLKKITLSPPYHEATPSKLQIISRRKKLEMAPRSSARVITRKAIMPPFILNLRPKNSCSLGNLHISNQKFGSQYWTLAAYMVHPVFGLILQELVRNQGLNRFQ